MRKTILGKAFSIAELRQILKISDTEAKTLAHSAKASISMSNLARLCPEFKAKANPWLPERVSKFRRSQYKIPPSLHETSIEFDPFDFEKIKIRHKKRTGTFKLNGTYRNRTPRELLKDIFEFVDLLEPGYRAQSPNKPKYFYGKLHKKCVRDKKALERIFKEELPSFRTLILEEKRPLEEIYGKIDIIVSNKIMTHKEIDQSHREYVKYDHSLQDFILLIEAIDSSYIRKNCSITGVTRYYTRMGDELGMEFNQTPFLLFVKGRHPVDRPYFVGEVSGWDYPVFVDNLKEMSNPLVTLDEVVLFGSIENWDQKEMYNPLSQYFEEKTPFFWKGQLKPYTYKAYKDAIRV